MLVSVRPDVRENSTREGGSDNGEPCIGSESDCDEDKDAPCNGVVGVGLPTPEEVNLRVRGRIDHISFSTIRRAASITLRCSASAMPMIFLMRSAVQNAENFAATSMHSQHSLYPSMKCVARLFSGHHSHRGECKTLLRFFDGRGMGRF